VKLRGERRVAARKILREQRPAAPERHAEMLRNHRFFEAAAQRAKRALPSLAHVSFFGT
jgi:hypothetical protein